MLPTNSLKLLQNDPVAHSMAVLARAFDEKVMSPNFLGRKYLEVYVTLHISAEQMLQVEKKVWELGYGINYSYDMYLTGYKVHVYCTLKETAQ